VGFHGLPPVTPPEPAPAPRRWPRQQFPDPAQPVGQSFSPFFRPITLQQGDVIFSLWGHSKQSSSNFATEFQHDGVASLASWEKGSREISAYHYKLPAGIGRYKNFKFLFLLFFL